MRFHHITNHESIELKAMPPDELAHLRTLANGDGQVRPTDYYIFRLREVLAQAGLNRDECTGDVFPKRPFGLHASEYLYSNTRQNGVVGPLIDALCAVVLDLLFGRSPRRDTPNGP